MQTVVIGAGVLGASTAYHLARAGVPVVIIEAGFAGAATAAGAGIICPWASGVRDEVFYQLYAAGGEYYADLVAQLAASGETDLGYRRSGALLVSGDPGELALIERAAVRRQRAAPAMGDVTRLSPKQAQEAFPPLRPDLGGVHVAGGARVDGRLLASALLRMAQRHGATLMRGEARVGVHAGRVTGVEIRREPMEADRGETLPADLLLPGQGCGNHLPAGQASVEWVAAERVIVTAGAWADRALRPVGLRLPVEPQRGQIIHLRLNGAATGRWPVVLPPGSHYIVPFDGGRVVAGATRETGAGFDYRVTAAGQAEVLSQALEVAPGLGSATMIETRVGFRPAGTGTRPLLGWAPPVEGLAIGNGLGAAGLTIGPLAGRLLADLVMRRPGLLDLAPFSPVRQATIRADTSAALR